MATDPSAPAASQRLPVAIQFGRFWCANMDMIHSKGSTWPGFGYTDDEKTQMHDVAQKMSSLEFFTAMTLIVILTILFAGGFIGLMFWRLQVKYGSDPSKTPPAEFFLMLALASVMTICAGMPLAIWITSWVTSRMFLLSPESLPDTAFARHIFVKSVRQIVRMGLLMSIAVLLYSLFVPSDSKINLILQTVIPVIAPVLSFLTSIYYFSGRAAKSADAQ